MVFLSPGGQPGLNTSGPGLAPGAGASPPPPPPGVVTNLKTGQTSGSFSGGPSPGGTADIINTLAAPSGIFSAPPTPKASPAPTPAPAPPPPTATSSPASSAPGLSSGGTELGATETLYNLGIAGQYLVPNTKQGQQQTNVSLSPYRITNGTGPSSYGQIVLNTSSGQTYYQTPTGPQVSMANGLLPSTAAPAPGPTSIGGIAPGITAAPGPSPNIIGAPQAVLPGYATSNQAAISSLQKLNAIEASNPAFARQVAARNLVLQQGGPQQIAGIAASPAPSGAITLAGSQPPVDYATFGNNANIHFSHTNPNQFDLTETINGVNYTFSGSIPPNLALGNQPDNPTQQAKNAAVDAAYGTLLSSYASINQGIGSAPGGSSPSVSLNTDYNGAPGTSLGSITFSASAAPGNQVLAQNAQFQAAQAPALTAPIVIGPNTPISTLAQYGINESITGPTLLLPNGWNTIQGPNGSSTLISVNGAPPTIQQQTEFMSALAQATYATSQQAPGSAPGSNVLSPSSLLGTNLGTASLSTSQYNNPITRLLSQNPNTAAGYKTFSNLLNTLSADINNLANTPYNPGNPNQAYLLNRIGSTLQLLQQGAGSVLTQIGTAPGYAQQAIRQQLYNPLNLINAEALSEQQINQLTGNPYAGAALGLLYNAGPAVAGGLEAGTLARALGYAGAFGGLSLPLTYLNNPKTAAPGYVLNALNAAEQGAFLGPAFESTLGPLLGRLPTIARLPAQLGTNLGITNALSYLQTGQPASLLSNALASAFALPAAGDVLATRNVPIDPNNPATIPQEKIVSVVSPDVQDVKITLDQLGMKPEEIAKLPDETLAQFLITEP